MIKNKIRFELINGSRVDIFRDKERIGQIFSPSGSGHNNLNSIQVCGFSEAFNLWGCGIYQGFKDIQLLFDGKKIGGRFNISNCYSCFHEPCQCETGKSKCGVTKGQPFKLKGYGELRHRMDIALMYPIQHELTIEEMELVVGKARKTGFDLAICLFKHGLDACKENYSQEEADVFKVSVCNWVSDKAQEIKKAHEEGVIICLESQINNFDRLKVELKKIGNQEDIIVLLREIQQNWREDIKKLKEIEGGK